MLRFQCCIDSGLFLRVYSGNKEDIDFNNHPSLISEPIRCPKCRKKGLKWKMVEVNESLTFPDRKVFCLFFYGVNAAQS